MNLKASLTNNDIIKALKDWAEKVNHAVYFEVNENGANELYENLLNAICLIDRLQSQNDALIAGQETLQKALAEKNAEIERLKEYEDIRPTGCPNCHRGNFSNSKFCSHCGTQLQGKKKDVRTEAIKELLDKIEKQAIPNEDDVYWVELDDIYNLVKEMVGDTE